MMPSRSPGRLARHAAAALLFATGLAAGLPSLARADARDERPWQLQFDTGGLTAGYHINPHWAVTVTSQPRILAGASYGKRYRDDSDHEIYDQRGVKEVDLTYSPRTSVEVRWTPWNHGLYFAGGILATGEDKQGVTYDARARVIGDNAYSNTAMKVDVQDQTQVAPAIGIGYLHVFSFGLSLGAGVLIAARVADPPDVKVTVTQGTVTAADLSKFK
ncbi:MAG TPA: hypothetical protein VF678_09655, partial [bacterium]